MAHSQVSLFFLLLALFAGVAGSRRVRGFGVVLSHFSFFVFQFLKNILVFPFFSV